MLWGSELSSIVTPPATNAVALRAEISAVPHRGFK